MGGPRIKGISVCVYVCNTVYVCMCIYVYVCVCIYVWLCIWVCESNTTTFVYIFTYVYVYKHISYQLLYALVLVCMLQKVVKFSIEAEFDCLVWLGLIPVGSASGSSHIIDRWLCCAFNINGTG